GGGNARIGERSPSGVPAGGAADARDPGDWRLSPPGPVRRRARGRAVDREGGVRRCRDEGPMNGRAMIALAATWLLLEGRIGTRALGWAVMAAFVALAVSGNLARRRRDPLRVRAWLRVGWVFLAETVIGTYQVARLVVAPGMRFRPAVLEVPVRVRRESAIALFAGMVAVIPGTLV